jgi:hypothetical protein
MAKEKPSKMTVMNPRSAESKEALKQMNPELKKLFDKLSADVMTANKRDVLAQFEIGKLIAAAKHDTNKYGEKAVELLAASLGMSASKAYQLSSFYMVWCSDLDTLKKLIDRRDAAGAPLSMSQLYALNYLKSHVDRLKLIERCFKECLTVEDLRAITADSWGKKSNNQGLVMPRSPGAGIAVMTKAIDKLETSHEKIQVSIFERIEDEPDEFANETTIGKLEDLMKHMAGAKKLIESDMIRLQNTINLLEPGEADEDDGDEDEEPVSKKDVPRQTVKTVSRPKTVTGPPNTTGVVSKIKAAQKARDAQRLSTSSYLSSV